MCGPGKKREEDGERQRYLGDYTLGHANTYGKIECWCGPLRFFQKKLFYAHSEKRDDLQMACKN